MFFNYYKRILYIFTDYFNCTMESLSIKVNTTKSYKCINIYGYKLKYNNITVKRAIDGKRGEYCQC